jgi:hypothetical protein
MKTCGLVMALFAAAVAFGQAPAKEPDTLQALLAEVRQLRQDIEAMTVASQRAQIGLYNLQMQDAAVTRSRQRLDEVRQRCSALESRRGNDAGEMQRSETEVTSGTLEPGQTKELQAYVLAQRKRLLESETADLQTCRVTESEAESQLRNDEVKLAGAQERIDRSEKDLDKIAAAGK